MGWGYAYAIAQAGTIRSRRQRPLLRRERLRLDDRRGGIVCRARRLHGGRRQLRRLADVYSRWVPGNRAASPRRSWVSWMKERGNRADVIVATKLGSPMGDAAKQGLSRRYMMAGRRGLPDSGSRPTTSTCTRRTATTRTTPLEETLGGVRRPGRSRARSAHRRLELHGRAAGRVERGQQAGGLPRYESIQPAYHLCTARTTSASSNRSARGTRSASSPTRRCRAASCPGSTSRAPSCRSAAAPRASSSAT